MLPFSWQKRFIRNFSLKSVDSFLESIFAPDEFPPCVFLLVSPKKNKNKSCFLKESLHSHSSMVLKEDGESSWWFQISVYFNPPILGKIPILMNIFFRWVGSITNYGYIWGGNDPSMTSMWMKFCNHDLPPPYPPPLEGGILRIQSATFFLRLGIRGVNIGV